VARIFIVQSTNFPTNDNLMELLICIDALRRASATPHHCGDPYFGYARQDRKPGRADLGQAGCQPDHDGRCEPRSGGRSSRRSDPGFFDIPTDNLFAAPTMAADIQSSDGGRPLMVVSPDVGGVVAPVRWPSGSTTRRSPSSTSVATVPASPK
jgi:ribose-phosphate pyrophosphokinase